MGCVLFPVGVLTRVWGMDTCVSHLIIALFDFCLYDFSPKFFEIVRGIMCGIICMCPVHVLVGFNPPDTKSGVPSRPRVFCATVFCVTSDFSAL